MRSRLAVVAVCILALSAFGAVQPAAASPAQRVDTAACLDAGAGITYCYQIAGVTQGTMSRSGNLSMNANLTLDYRFLYGGQTLLSQSEKLHLNLLFKAGEPQVYHMTRKGTLVVANGAGTTLRCTYNRNVMVANGAVRSDVSNMACG